MFSTFSKELVNLIAFLGRLWRAGGKPSTWFPPGRLVEQSGVKEEAFTENNSKETEQKSNAKRQPKSTRAKQGITN